jgi:hypothetical protein
MRRITNGVPSNKGFPKNRVVPRPIPQPCWAALAKKADLDIGEAEAYAQLKDKYITVILKPETKIADKFAAEMVQVWECRGNWAHFKPNSSESGSDGMLWLGDIQKIIL